MKAQVRSGNSLAAAPERAIPDPQEKQRAIADPQEKQRAIPDAQAKQRMIAEAAYARWERRGFVHGADVQDWLEAEAEIDGRAPS